MFGSPDIHRAGSRSILACPYCHGLQAIPPQPVRLAIDAQYNDMFKFIFGFGGGNLRILDREGNLLREIRWVFFLPRVRQRIDEIVEVTPVAALSAFEARHGSGGVPPSRRCGRGSWRVAASDPRTTIARRLTHAQLLRRRLGRDNPHRAVPLLRP